MEDFSMMPVDWNSKFSRFQSLYYMTISFYSCHSYWWIAFIVCQYIYIHHCHEWLNLKCCMVGQTSAFNSHINSRQSDQGFYVQCKSAGSQAGELPGEIRWKEICKDSLIQGMSRWFSDISDRLTVAYENVQCYFVFLSSGVHQGSL